MPKVSYPSHVVQPTRAMAERAVTQWARDFVNANGEVIEASLRLREEAEIVVQEVRSVQ